jgi:phage gpG-like protein
MNNFNINQALQKLQQQKSTLPQALAEATQQYFNKSLDSQAWNGHSWQLRKPQKPANTKPILYKTGALKNAVSKSLVKTDFKTLKFEVQNIPYAKVHNDGLKTGRGRGFKMPQRQFIGHAEELANIQKKIIKTYISKLWTK